MTYRKLALRLIASIAGCALILTTSAALMGASGCNTPQTVSALITAVGTTGEALATANGHATAATAIQLATVAAAKGAANWQSGAGTKENAIQLFGVLQGLLVTEVNAIDPGSNLALYATIISAGIQGVIAALPVTVTTSPAFKANVSIMANAPPPIANQKDYKVAWNAALAAHPVAGLKPLK